MRTLLLLLLRVLLLILLLRASLVALSSCPGVPASWAALPSVPAGLLLAETCAFADPAKAFLAPTAP